METLKELLSPKSFNSLSFVVVLGSLVVGIILLGVIANIETDENFSCRIKEEAKGVLQRACFDEYRAKTTRGLPLYGFVLLYFLSGTLVCGCYSQSVRSILENLEREDPEIQTIPNSCRLYRRYCFQLAARFILGMIFLILQWGVFYPVKFPSEYACDLSSTHQAKHKNITRGDAANATKPWYVCYNPQAGKKTFWTTMVFIVSFLLNILILLELIYVICKAQRQVEGIFREDIGFFNIYLQNKGKVVEGYVAKMKKNIKSNTVFYEPLVPNIPGEERKLLKLDDLYTNLIMYHGRAEYTFSGKRHEINEGYLKSQEHHRSTNKIEDIFAPEPGNSQERPRSIMIIGRPGIGKSLLCLKILRDWACGNFNEETEAGKCFKFVYFFKFRHFKGDEEMNLQQLLGRGQFSPAFPYEVYNYILRHPENVLLIFDGLDEFGKKEDIVKEEGFGNTLAETVPFSALYSKLVLGKLFEGATVVTTSRPTALSYVSFPNKTFDRTLEALGFDLQQIGKYVKRFCHSNVYGEKIWNHINSNANLLSLCYIPVNCHIVCFSLQERLKLNQDEIHDLHDLPTTLTEIYEDALRIIVCKHNLQYRCSVQEQEELLSTLDFTPEVEKSLECLGEIAYKGIEEDRLIFESNEVKNHEESGLLHRLPDERVGTTQHKKQYCFLHLTIQELMAARYIVAHLLGRNQDELQSWISKHLDEGKWEVVIQFVAGLVRHDNSMTMFFIRSLPRRTSCGGGWPFEKSLVVTLCKCIFEISRNSNNEWESLVADTLFDAVNVDLSYASLTDVDLMSIVFVLQQAKRIESVDVRYNYITPNGCLTMSKLLATKECKLTTLNISYSQIGNDGLKHLSDALATKECKLTTLRISFTQIGDEGLKQLSGALSKDECKLTTLDIIGNQIGDDGLKHLSDALSKDECKLTTLDISGNQIGDDGLKHLSDALATKGGKLTTLNINYSQIGDDGLKHLSDALATEECKLTTLDISANQIGDDGLKYLSYALAKEECKLTWLNISGNQIGDDGLKHLSDALSKDEFKLTTLKIIANRVGDDGLKHLSDALSKDECKLTTLKISGNQIGDDGLKYLSDALSKDECKLTELDISGNQIGDDGLKYLSVALATEECKLTELDISDNQIGNDGLKHLWDALATKECKLTTLYISGGQISDDGLKHLWDALATKECKLTELYIMAYQLSDEGLKHLTNALAEKECKLTTLYFNGRKIFGQ